MCYKVCFINFSFHHFLCPNLSLSLPPLVFPVSSPVIAADTTDTTRLRDDEHWLEEYEGLTPEQIHKVC